jgi:uncharacterized SAM-dependent methyltransferase
MSEYSDQVVAAAEDAHVVIAAIADELETDFRDRAMKHRASYLRRQARRLRAALKALEDEAAMLSAGVCEHRLGNDHGNAYCGKTGDLL